MNVEKLEANQSPQYEKIDEKLFKDIKETVEELNERNDGRIDFSDRGSIEFIRFHDKKRKSSFTVMIFTEDEISATIKDFFFNKDFSVHVRTSIERAVPSDMPGKKPLGVFSNREEEVEERSIKPREVEELLKFLKTFL